MEISKRERYLMQAAIDAADKIESLDRWLSAQVIDIQGSTVEQILSDEADAHAEEFSNDQVTSAIKSFLDYGESSFVDDRPIGSDKGHGGYFSGMGWAATVLRFHLEELKAAEVNAVDH